jgi:predicted nucleic acid-binding protein
VLRIPSDTNVIVSALNFPGNASRILDLAEAGEICLAVSDDILNEVNRVLLRRKFGWSQDRVDAAIRQIAGFAEHVEPKQRIAFLRSPAEAARTLAGPRRRSADTSASVPKPPAIPKPPRIS